MTLLKSLSLAPVLLLPLAGSPRSSPPAPPPVTHEILITHSPHGDIQAEDIQDVTVHRGEVLHWTTPEGATRFHIVFERNFCSSGNSIASRPGTVSASAASCTVAAGPGSYTYSVHDDNPPRDFGLGASDPAGMQIAMGHCNGCIVNVD